MEISNKVHEAIDGFKLPGELKECIRYGSGHINDTYRLTYETPQGTKRYILQRMSKSIFKKPVELMEKVRFDVIRGNISEVKTLAQGSGTTKGVDADVADAVTEENLEEGIAFAKAFAKKAGCIVAITGAIDLVSDGASCYIIRNGRPEMGKITGTGCQLSGMMTAFLAANPEQKLEAAAAAVCTMGLAGEIGWGYMQKGDGNATYRNRIIDAIYNMDKETLEKGAKYEIR